MNESQSIFLTQLLALLNAEHSLSLSEFSLLYTRASARDLERSGLCLNNLAVASLRVGFGGKTVVEFERESAIGGLLPVSGWRTGDNVEIVDVKEDKEKAGAIGKSIAQGVVQRVAEGKITVVLDEKGATGAKEIELPERCRILKTANTVVHMRMVKTLQRLQTLFPSDISDSTNDGKSSNSSPAKLSFTPLISVLLNLSMPTPPPNIVPNNRFFYDETLNDTQKEAVTFALAQPELALIHGPPGTGKTKTLVEIIRQLVSPPPSSSENSSTTTKPTIPKKVLVCGGSNLSVDNLVERLVPLNLPLIRLGHPARVLPSLVTATLDWNSVNCDSGQIVKDVKNELEQTLKELKSGKVRGKARKEGWSKVSDLRKEYKKREANVATSIISSSKIVLCTCHGAGSRQIQNETFDVVIIDEAAQAIEPACWIPILKGKKLILAGDHLQLPPTVKSRDRDVKDKKESGNVKREKTKMSSSKINEGNVKKIQSKKEEDGKVNKEKGKKEGTKKEGTKKEPEKEKDSTYLAPSPSLEFTLFDRLQKRYGTSISRMLKVQYRMHERICDFPSSTLYDNELVSDESVKNRLLVDLVSGGDGDEVLKEPVIFIDTAGSDMYEKAESDEKTSSLGTDTDSKSNENEATLVVRHVETLIASKIPPSSIAIISPYNAQVTLLSTLLKSQYPEIEIGSVDGFQGREKEAVIVSLVRSNSEREVGFLKEKRRLNVAMTRAKRHLVVIGDSSTVSEGSDYLKKWMQWLEENADVRLANEFI